MAFLALFISLFLQGLPILQSEEYLVENFTVEDGLPVNSINRILQDDNGYLWFSTLDGLVRYDGYDFRVFNSGNTEGMISNRIAGMIKADSNEIWMIQADGLIMRKAGSTFTTYTESNGDFKGTAIRVIESKNGDIWISTSRGISWFNKEAQSFQSPDEPLLQSGTWAIESTVGGGILAINENGLLLWENNKTSVLVPLDDFPIPPRAVSQIKQFKPGEFWVMGGGGLFRYSLSERNIDFLYRSNHESFGIGNLHPEPDGTFIINSSTGFYSLNPQTEQVVKLQPEFEAAWERINLVFRGLNDEKIRLTGNEVFIDNQKVLETTDIQSGLIDSEGSLWISTMRDGVFQIRKSDFSNITSGQIRGFENIYSVIQSPDEAIWAGSFVNGIYRIDGENVDNWNAENSSLPSNFCRFLFNDSDGTVYAGMWAFGLWEFLENEWQGVKSFNNLFDGEVTVEAMYRDQLDRLLIGTSGQMVIRQNGQYRFFDDPGNPAHQAVRVIRENADGTLFLGTNGNGFSIISNGSTQHYTTENSGLTSNFIRDFYVQSADTLWLATENLGLNRVVLNDGNAIAVKSITERDGLIKNSLHRIIETPDRHLWISSNGGIMRISLNELNRYADGQTSSLSILAYNENNGMVNREANGGVQTAGLLTSDQELWFPNQQGITIIDPLKVSEGNTVPGPTPIIEEIVLSDTTLFIENHSDIELPAGARNMRIVFSAPNFSSSDRIQFRYKLDGVNPEWENGTRSREAVLTNIPPGIHEFQLMVNRTGSPEVRRASIAIITPYFFYETTWFYGVLGMLGILIIIGGIKYRTRILEQRERKLQNRVDQQTEALKVAAEQKSRFFSGITHELKTPLSLIVSPLEDILEKQENIPDDSTRNRLHLMHRNGRQLKNLVDQILDVTKLNSDAIKLTLKPVNLPELTRQVIGQFQSKLEQEKIELVFESDPIDELIYLDVHAWERIVINLLNNAIRFSPRGSTIHINISNLENEVSVSVKDEGIGIDKNEAGKVFEYLYQAEGADAAEGTGIGLYLVKGLVEHMGGSIDLKSKKGKGARFTVSLKKGFEHFEASDTVIHEPVTLRELKTTSKRRKKNKTPQQIHKKNLEQILVVEDNFDFRNYLVSILTEHYKVAEAAEGSEALEILKKNKTNLVISDVMMPGMNGLEFVTNLRKIEDYKHLPVIFLSAKNLEIDVETGLSSGADIYLTKPIKSKLLLSQVSAVLRRENILRSGQIIHTEANEAELMQNIREIVYRQLANPALNISMLGDALFMSRTTLYKEWNQISNISLNDFIKKIRLNEAKILLTEQNFSVQEAATAVGYSDPNYFSTSFKKEFGVSPSEFK